MAQKTKVFGKTVVFGTKQGCCSNSTPVKAKKTTRKALRKTFKVKTRKRK